MLEKPPPVELRWKVPAPARWKVRWSRTIPYELLAAVPPRTRPPPALVAPVPDIVPPLQDSGAVTVNVPAPVIVPLLKEVARPSPTVCEVGTDSVAPVIVI